MIDLGLVWLTGLLASLHCAGMCGPIVLAYSLPLECRQACVRGQVAMPGLHVAYNASRIASYAMLGAAAGTAGHALGSLRAIGPYIATAGGTMMIFSGIILLGVVPLPAAVRKGWTARGVVRAHALVLRAPTIWSKVMLGMFTPLLPCGVLYAMAVKAATTQSAPRGALVMAVFGLGMAPALVALGALSSLISAKLRNRAEKVAAGGVVLIGTLLVLRGLGVPYLSWLQSGVTTGASCCH